VLPPPLTPLFSQPCSHLINSPHVMTKPYSVPSSVAVMSLFLETFLPIFTGDQLPQKGCVGGSPSVAKEMQRLISISPEGGPFSWVPALFAIPLAEVLRWLSCCLPIQRFGKHPLSFFFGLLSDVRPLLKKLPSFPFFPPMREFLLQILGSPPSSFSPTPLNGGTIGFTSLKWIKGFSLIKLIVQCIPPSTFLTFTCL